MLENNEKVIYEFTVEEATKITLSTGNSKIGRMINWSTLPGDADHPLVAKGRQVTNVPGTCTSKCEGCFKNCYARRSILQHHNSVTRSWAINTLMIRHKPEECFRQIDAEIRRLNKKYFESGNPTDLKYEFFRINVSGELDSLEELERWNALAAAHPELKFGIYSKNAEVLIMFFMKHHQTAPNFCVNVSEWHGTMADTIKRLHNMGVVFNVFEYDDSNLRACDLSEEEKERLQTLSHCMAVTKEGHHYYKPNGEPLQCADCQRCYNKTGKVTAVYSH